MVGLAVDGVPSLSPRPLYLSAYAGFALGALAAAALSGAAVPA
jgi:hypothetical protein